MQLDKVGEGTYGVVYKVALRFRASKMPTRARLAVGRLLAALFSLARAATCNSASFLLGGAWLGTSCGVG